MSLQANAFVSLSAPNRYHMCAIAAAAGRAMSLDEAIAEARRIVAEAAIRR